jgi:hypothetical protein
MRRDKSLQSNNPETNGVKIFTILCSRKNRGGFAHYYSESPVHTAHTAELSEKEGLKREKQNHRRTSGNRLDGSFCGMQQFLEQL